MIAQQSLECGAPVPLWIWYDVKNIQPMPEDRSFTAEPKRRRVAAVQSQALPESQIQQPYKPYGKIKHRLLRFSLGHWIFPASRDPGLRDRILDIESLAVQLDIGYFPALRLCVSVRKYVQRREPGKRNNLRGKITAVR